MTGRSRGSRRQRRRAARRLGDAIGGRVDEGAERRGLVAGARQRAVQDVDDRADQEDGGRHDVVLAVDQHGGDKVKAEAERGQLVGRDTALAEDAHGARGELAGAVGVARFDPSRRMGNVLIEGKVAGRPAPARDVDERSVRADERSVRGSSDEPLWRCSVVTIVTRRPECPAGDRVEEKSCAVATIEKTTSADRRHELHQQVPRHEHAGRADEDRGRSVQARRRPRQGCRRA